MSYRILLAMILLAVGMPASGQDLSADFIASKTYPSLITVPVVRVHIADSDALGPDPARWKVLGFDPAKLACYRISTDKGRQITIRSVHFARMVRTEGPDFTLAYLELNATVHKGDSLVLTVLDTKGTPIPKAQKTVQVGDIQTFTINLTPSSAPSEPLTDGNTRDVAQLKVEIAKPDLFRWKQARTYLESADVFSTDAKDINSKFEGTFGLERNLLSSWYVPIHGESKVQGDQTARNLSYLAGMGLKTLLPWQHAKPVLYNSAIQTPVSPVITLDAQYERRINQDAASLQKFPNKNAFRVNPALSWTPIRLLPGLTPDLLDAEVNLKAWYLPFDQTVPTGGSQRLEGAADVSLIIPLSKLNFLGHGLTFQSQGDPAKTQIRIKYSTGANEADGFKHSTHITFGVEVSP